MREDEKEEIAQRVESSRRRFLKGVAPVSAALGGSLLCGSFAGAAPSKGAGHGASAMGFLNVSDFGARGDGADDQTTAFQNALDAAQKLGGATVYARPGRYLFRGNLKIPSAVTLAGSFHSVPAHNGIRDAGLPKPGEDGTTLMPTAGRGAETGDPFLSLTTNSVVQGLVIYYPDQDPKATPVPYPWAIAMRGKNPAVLDVELLNPYQGIDATNNERHNIRNIAGQPLRRGILIDQIYDVGRIENVHFNPWWSVSDPVIKLMVTEGEAFILGKTDWEYMLDCFSIIYHTGYRFTQFAHGPGNVILTQCGHDIAPYCVRVEYSQGHAGIAFSNSQFMGAVEVLETNAGPVKFNNCGFWGVGPGNFQNPGTASQGTLAGAGHVTYVGCHFTGWGQRDPAAPCIRARCDSLTLMGCDLMDDKPHLSLDPAVKAAIIVGNRFRGGARIDNRAASAQIGLNSDV